MSIPDYQTLMLPVLKKSRHGEVRISKVVEELADELGLSDDEKAELLPSGKQTTIANRIHWAKTYLKQAGLVDATKRGTLCNFSVWTGRTCAEPRVDRQSHS